MFLMELGRTTAHKLKAVLLECSRMIDVTTWSAEGAEFLTSRCCGSE
jgi:hypothetical protein